MKHYKNKKKRNICHQPRDAHTTPLFLSTNTLKLPEIHKLQVAKFTYNQLSNSIVGENSLVKLEDKHHYATRATATNSLYLSSVKTKLGLRSINYQAPTIWNNIPKEIKDSKNINIFKNRYKKLLLKTYSQP